MFQGVQIQCVGEGPVIHVVPAHVDYGTIPVLTDISKIVQLSNESLIPAQFSCSMVSIVHVYHHQMSLKQLKLTFSFHFLDF